MTNAEPNANEQQALALPPSGSSLGKRVFEWFWRGSAVAEKRCELPSPEGRFALLSQRARATADMAFALLSPAEPLEIPVEGSAAELYRQSAYWALCALSGDAPSDSTYAELVWDALDEASLALVAETADRREVLPNTLRKGSFVYFAALPAAEQAVACLELRKLAESLLNQLNKSNRALEAAYLQRASRLAMLVMFALALLGGTLAFRQWRENRNDLARGKPWRTSSAEFSCHPERSECGGANTNILFHTKLEESPWFEYDLGEPLEFSSLTIRNRTDYGPELALPLIVEASDDGKHYRELARRTEVFTTWRPSFAPTRARYVRLRVGHKTFLHLELVQVHP